MVPLRRLVHRHHDRHQQMGAHVPEPEAGVRRQPGLLVVDARRGFADIILPACTNSSATTSANGASLGGTVEGRQQRLQLTASSCASRNASSRCGNRSPTTRSSRCSRGGWASSEEYTERQDRAGLGAEVLRDFRPAEVHLAGRSSIARATTSSTSPEDYKPTPALRWYAEGRACDTPDPSNPKRLTEQGARTRHLQRQDRVRLARACRQHCARRRRAPAVPHYMPSWEGHRITELVEKYPLQLISPHPRFTFHTHYDKHAAWLDEIPVHRIKKDGYAWWPARIHPDDAAARGIRNGDIVRLYNDRARCCASRSSPSGCGAASSTPACRRKYDPLEPGKAEFRRSRRLRGHAHAGPHDLEKRCRHGQRTRASSKSKSGWGLRHNRDGKLRNGHR